MALAKAPFLAERSEASTSQLLQAYSSENSQNRDSASFTAWNSSAAKACVDVITNRKSQTGKFQITGTFKTTEALKVRCFVGKFVSGMNSWQALANPMFFNILIYDTVTGQSTPITFNGKRTGKCSFGWIDSDPFYMSSSIGISPGYPAGNHDLALYCDSFVENLGDELLRNRIANPQLNEGVSNSSSGILDFTTKVTRTQFAGVVGANTSIGYCPVLMAVPAGPTRRAVIYGDSRVDFLGDSAPMSSNGWEDSSWWSKAALSKRASITALAASGSRLHRDVANDFALMRKQFEYCKDIGAERLIAVTWANDAINGRQFSQITNDILTLDAECTRRGMELWVATNPPLNSRSSDNYLTVEQQYPETAQVEAVRVLVNRWIRVTFPKRCVELADALESARGSGKYKAAVPTFIGTVVNPVATSVISKFSFGGGSISYGRYRNDAVVFEGNITPGLARSTRTISNSFLIGADNRFDLNSAVGANAGDDFQLLRRYTSDGLHWRNEISQAAAAKALIVSGALDLTG